ncbi:hypothetical protein [Microbacterium xylanilyticum]
MSGTRAQRRAVMTARRWRILRRWIYSVSIAAIPLGIYLKLIPAEAAPVILPVILALVMVKPDGTPEDIE